MFTAAAFELQSVELPEARKVDRRGQARNLTSENLRAIFAELPSDKWRAVFAIAYFTGSRISEVLSLDVSDIGSDRVSFRRENTKTKKPRVAMVVDALQPFLAAYNAPQSGPYSRPTTMARAATSAGRRRIRCCAMPVN